MGADFHLTDIVCLLVDGANIFPKIPVPICVYQESFARNQCVKECVSRANKGQKILNELNDILQLKTAEVAHPIPNPDPLPIIYEQGMYDLPYITTSGTAVKNLLINTCAQKRRRGETGPHVKKRSAHMCWRCSGCGGLGAPI